METLDGAGWSIEWFVGVVRSFAQHRPGVTMNHARGAARLASRWGASRDGLESRVSQDSPLWYRPDPDRMAELSQLLKSL